MQEDKNVNDIIRKFEPVLNQLTYDELNILNRMIVDRIRFMHKAGALASMARFNVGDTVQWTAADGKIYSGLIIRLNQKTASIKTEHSQWNVSPQFLRKE